MDRDGSDDIDIADVAGALFVNIGLLRRKLRQHQVPGDLSFPETAALARLDRGGAATSAELARQEQISPQSMGATLVGLCERGFITRHPDPDDGRRVLLSITDRGRRALRRAAAGPRRTTGARTRRLHRPRN